MAANLPEALVRQLSPLRVRWYAVQAGWKPVEGIRRPVIVLNHPTDELTQLQIPTAGSNRDWTFLMGEAVRQLAEAEGRPALEVLHDLALAAVDAVGFQVGSRAAEDTSGRPSRKETEPRRERVEGRVFSLQAEPAQPSESLRGYVTICALVNGQASSVRFLLPAADFTRACDALRDRQCVAVTGVLRRDREANRFDLLHPQHFQVPAVDGAEP